MAFNKMVENMTFGVEVECNVPATAPRFQLGSRHAGQPVAWLPAFDGRLWRAEHDGSVMPSSSGMLAVEFVSPVLRGTKGLENVLAVLKVLQSVGAKPNQTCGFHVHVGFDSNKISDLKKICAYVSQYERAFYAASGTKAREQGRWCKSIKGYKELGWAGGRVRSAFGRKSIELPGFNRDRYMLLNLDNLAMGGKPTVEFRCFSGTTNPLKAVSFVRMCLAAVENALNFNRALSFDGKERDGREALLSFFKSTGWKPSGPMAKQGLWNAGIMESAELPTTADSMAMLWKLACKYDGAVSGDAMPE